MFNILPIKCVTKLFKSMMSQRLNNFKYLTSKTFELDDSDNKSNQSKYKIKPLSICKSKPFVMYNNFTFVDGKKIFDVFPSNMIRPYGWLLPRINLKQLGSIKVPIGSDIESKNKQYRMDKFLSIPQNSYFEPIHEIIENKSKYTNVVNKLIFSSENVTDVDQMLELLKLIKFNLYNEKEEKKLIICLDNYQLKYSDILFGPMKFEICYKENQSNLYCSNNIRDIYTIIIYMAELFNEVSPEKRNNKNYELIIHLYIKYILQ